MVFFFIFKVYDDDYCIDLQTIPSLPGFIVSNFIKNRGKPKKTMVSYNYGKTWTYIEASKTLEVRNCYPVFTLLI